MTESQLRAYEVEIAALQDCESLAVIGRVEHCEIGNFPVIASPDRPPVAYVADEQNARFFAGAPKLVGDLCAEIRRLQIAVADYPDRTLENHQAMWGPETTHTYTSTACFHGQHERCRKGCKFCGNGCCCPCHQQPRRTYDTSIRRYPVHIGQQSNDLP